MGIINLEVLDEFVEVHQNKWNYTDPRHHTGKKRKIIISDNHMCWFGFAETKYGWNVFNEIKFISADDEWPANWGWIDDPTWTLW